jgi:hypothetical protein
MSGSAPSQWVRFLRNYGPIPNNDNMYDESIQRALRRHRIEPLVLPAQFIAPLLRRGLKSSPARLGTGKPIIVGKRGRGSEDPTPLGKPDRRSKGYRSVAVNSSW